MFNSSSQRCDSKVRNGTEPSSQQRVGRRTPEFTVDSRRNKNYDGIGRGVETSRQQYVEEDRE